MANNCDKIYRDNQTQETHFPATDELCNSRPCEFKAKPGKLSMPESLTGFKLLLVIAFSIVVHLEAYSQADMDYAIHANIVYRFTKYIDWPANKKSGDFVIGIVGDSPLYDELKHFIINKTVGRQRIVIKKLSPALESYNCHILFVTEEKSNSLKKIAENTKGTSTLLVSESDGLARKGSCINFIVVEDHLKIEINKSNIDQRDLSIATELLSLGIIIK